MLAPIVIFAYNRPDHLEKTLQSLQQNILSDQSELFIFIDGPKAGATNEQLQNIEEVKKVAGSKPWCQKVNIIESVANKGLAKSVIEGVTSIVNKYNKIIVLEDDLVSDKYFLKFMNDSLDRYENNDEVVCVTGYIYPVKKVLPETFFLKGADCWGWATWKRGWDCLETDGKKLLAEIQNRKLEFDFDFFGTYPYVQMLKDQVEGKNNSWAILWYASAYLKNKLTLYPGFSLIQNIGNDGSGTHNGSTEEFETTLQKKEIKTFPLEINESVSSKTIISDYFNSLHPKKRSWLDKLLGLKK